MFSIIKIFTESVHFFYNIGIYCMCIVFLHVYIYFLYFYEYMYKFFLEYRFICTACTHFSWNRHNWYTVQFTYVYVYTIHKIYAYTECTFIHTFLEQTLDIYAVFLFRVCISVSSFSF